MAMTLNLRRCPGKRAPTLEESNLLRSQGIRTCLGPFMGSHRSRGSGRHGEVAAPAGPCPAHAPAPALPSMVDPHELPAAAPAASSASAAPGQARSCSAESGRSCGWLQSPTSSTASVCTQRSRSWGAASGGTLPTASPVPPTGCRPNGGAGACRLLLCASPWGSGCDASGSGPRAPVAVPAAREGASEFRDCRARRALPAIHADSGRTS